MGGDDSGTEPVQVLRQECQVQGEDDQQGVQRGAAFCPGRILVHFARYQTDKEGASRKISGTNNA